jgi:hypothetical protein
MAGTCSIHDGMKNPYSRLIGKPQFKSPLWDLGLDERIIIKWI